MSITGKDLLPNFCLKKDDYAVIKISTNDTNFITTITKFYIQLVVLGAKLVLLVAYDKSGGSNKDTKDIFARLWKEIAKDEKFSSKKFQSTIST